MSRMKWIISIRTKEKTAMSSIDAITLYRASDPGRTLNVADPADKQYYIDFTPVRGRQIIENICDNISVWSPDKPTCQLFTGHLGCGK